MFIGSSVGPCNRREHRNEWKAGKESRAVCCCRSRNKTSISQINRIGASILFGALEAIALELEPSEVVHQEVWFRMRILVARLDFEKR